MSTLPPTWSACECVLITIVTGLSVNVLILARSAFPIWFSASTTMAPVDVRKTAEFPPPPFTTKTLSLTF